MHGILEDEFVYIVVLLSTALNFCKFNVIINLFWANGKYQIFPWSSWIQESSSNPLWLFFHLISALSHVFLSGCMVMDRHEPNHNKDYLAWIHKISHYLFCGLILFNINHFGEVSHTMAMIINGIPLLIALISHQSKWKYRDIIYFVTIASPVFLETALRIKSLVKFDEYEKY